MKVIGVIPSRFGSTRFPGKPLAMIAGRPMLQWVIEGARGSRLLNEVLVATDDERIRELSERCGARAVMTESALPTGTDRVWAAARGLGADIVVNIQGDEPLIDGRVLDALVEPLLKDAAIEMATLARALDEESLASMNTAKIVLNARAEALYFSRFPIPYSREKGGDCALKHIGIYAYRTGFLERFCAQAPTELERAEGLEQLRALYLGARIRVVKVEHEAWGVDTPSDVQKIEDIIRQREIKRGGPIHG